ncbi:MAG: biotin-dependent carboxyltransferase family protein [Kofleriaceae bacterium]
MTLVAVRVVGLVTVQDLGRPGRMHEALPAAGALVPELLIAANRAAHNPDGAPALEVLGQLVVRAARELEIAVDLAPASLRAGEERRIVSEPRRVTYLAVRGGIAVPRVLGGRATQLSAGIGSALRSGDPIAIADAAALAVPAARLELDVDAAIRIVPGPDLDAFPPDALARLIAGPYRISPRSDRVGTRLDGRPIPRLARVETSRPMVAGAIEVPADGMPIVLGPEHPTTGGYPILAVVVRADLGRCHAIRIGGLLRLALRA